MARKNVIKYANKMWRRSVFDLLTRFTQPLNQLPTELLAVESSFIDKTELKKATVRYIRETRELVWDAARAGWARSLNGHTGPITLPPRRDLRVLAAAAHGAGAQAAKLIRFPAE